MTEFGDINVTGGNNVNQFGDNNTGSQTNQFGDQVPEWKVPILDLQEQVKDQSWPDETEPYIKEEYAAPQTMLGAAMSEAEDQIENAPEMYEGEDFTEQKTLWADRFKALLPLGVKITGSVGKAVVDSYVSKSPVVAGLQALFTEIQSVGGE